MTIRHLPAAITLAITILGATTAQAQLAVYDATSYAKLIQQAQTAVSQLEQMKQQVTQGSQLLTSLNQNSNVNALASVLNTPALRQILPDAEAYIAAAKGGLGQLGQIGQQALAIRQTNRLYTPPAGDSLGQDLEAAGNRDARDLAAAQAVGQAAATRLQGLQQLQSGLETAPNARAVLDLQARLAAEQAMTANDQMRLQALAMTQDAEGRLARQRAQERAAAADAARLAFFRSGFQ